MTSRTSSPGLRADGVLVRPRLSERNPGQVTGYAVALTGDTDRDGNPIYFGGGKLAADLTLPKLQRRWQLAAAADAARPRPESTDQTGRPAAGEEPAPAAGRRVLSDAERAQVWEHAIAAAARATRQVMAAALTDPDAAGDAAWAAADFLTAAARVVDGRRRGPLTAAAEEYDGAARELYGRHPQPRRAGHELRHAARILLLARSLSRGDTRQLLELLARMVAFTEAVARLRDTQQRAAQAAAARRAAEQLRHCRLVYADAGVPATDGPADLRRRRRTATGTGLADGVTAAS